MLLVRILRYCPSIALAFFIGCNPQSSESPKAPEAVENKNEEGAAEDGKPGNQNPPANPTNVPDNESKTESNRGSGGNGGSGGGGGSTNRGTSEVVSLVGPNGVCGNGVQEVLPGAHARCIYDLYGTSVNTSDGASALHFFAKDTGVGYLIGTITENTVGVKNIGAIDFGSDGSLYGIGQRNSDNKSVFLRIDCVSAEATVIGLTNIDSLYGADATISDIDIDSLGRIYAFSDSLTNPNVLGLINETNGAFTAIGPAGLAISASEQGNGIASAPFLASTLYHAGELNLSSLNIATGLATTIDGLEFVAPADTDPRISAMDHDAFNDITYIVINDPQLLPLIKNDAPFLADSYVAKIDRATGTTSYLPLGPQLAPVILDGFAVNQHYEECDFAAENNPTTLTILPEGTDCTENCSLFESDCADGDDNDSDGSVDCADSDCADQACNDEADCTLDDVCVSGACVGTPNPCIDENPCTVDGICIEEENGACDYSQLEARPNFGDCEVDGLACTLGKCIDEEGEGGPECFEQNRALLSIEIGGCLDDNPCTADGCVDIPLDENEPVSLMTLAPFAETTAQCIYDSLVGTLCLPSADSCLEGVCELTGNGTPSSPYDVQCLNFIPRSCDDNNSCTIDSCIEGTCSHFDDCA